MERQLLTIPDFVSVYRLSRTAAYREIKAGRLKTVKVGTRTYIAAQDAQDWLKTMRGNHVVAPHARE